MEQVPSSEIKGPSDKTIRSKSPSDMGSLNPSITDGTQSDRSSRSKRKSSLTSASLSNKAGGGASLPDSFNPPSLVTSPSDHSGPRNDITVSSRNTIKEVGKVSSTPAKDKKTDKSNVDCLNLVSKACFRKVPPSAFYLFFPPKSTREEYTYSTSSIDKDVPAKTVTLPEITQKGILHTEKDLEVSKEAAGKSVKILGFGMGEDADKNKFKVTSDQSLGTSLENEQQSSSGTHTSTKKKLKKVITKRKKGDTELQKSLQTSSLETVDASLSYAEPDKVVDSKAPDKNKGKLLIRKSASSPMEEGSTTETIEKKTMKKKLALKAKAKKPKKGATAKDDAVSVISLEAAEKEHDQEELDSNEHGLELKHSENTLEATGSFDVMDKIHDSDAVGKIAKATDSKDDIDKVWKSGVILSADEMLGSDVVSSPIEPTPLVVPTTVSVGSEDSADSSSSSSSGSTQSKQVTTHVAVATKEQENEAQASSLKPQESQPSRMRGQSVLATQSFACPTPSFMIQKEPSMMGRSGPGSLNSLLVEEPPDILQAVSSCTIQLLKTYNALVEDKSDEQWAPIKDLMSVMSYDELTRRRESELEEDFETNRDSYQGNDKNQDEDVSSIQEEVLEDSSSSQSLGSDVIPATGSSVVGPKESKLMPDNFSEKEFMKYFCSDWEDLPYEASTKSAPKKIVTVKEEVHKTVSEAIDQIDPNATYDVIFTYKMPKSAPFDLNDSLADVRFKSVQKWMNDNVNASYRTFFDSELRGKAEEKVIRRLMEKMMSLQLKIKEYEDLSKMKPVYPPPTESSKSTFSADQGFANKYEEIEEEEGLEESSVHPSDQQIDIEIGILMTKLEQLRPEDSEVKDRRIVESVDTNATEHVISEKFSQSAQSLCSSGSGSRRYTMETRGKRRRREVKEQLEKVIGSLEKKLNRLKIKIDALPFDEYEHEIEESGEFESPIATKRSKYNQPDTQTATDSPADQDTLIRDVEAKLRRDFLIGFAQKNESKWSETVSRGGSHRSTRKYAESPTRRIRLQQYLLGLTDTWYQEESEASLSDPDIRDERLLGSLRKEDVQAGIKHIKHQKRHMKHLPSEHQKAKVKSLEAEDTYGKSQQASVGTKLKTTGTDQSKNRTALDPHAQVPFTCKCLCDRVSRFNAKRKEHFRTVLSENLWCLRSNPQFITGDKPESHHSVQEAGTKTLCPPEEIDEPDNFKGWLADTDRSLLLLFNRSPLDRLKKDYYGQPEPEERPPSPEMENDSKTILKNRIEDSLKNISKQEAEKFWVQVEKWYENYKKCDKTRQLIEEFEKIDINAMMKRDLSLLQNEMNEKLKADKMKMKLHLELHHRRMFFENLKKLRDEYECSVRNRIAAKEKEMEAKKSFVVQNTLRDMKEKFTPIKEEHKKRCIEWMAQIRDRTNATSQTVKQREARELALTVDKMDVAERTRKKLVAATGKEHEEMEKTLGKAVEERDVLIEELNRKVDNLTRDVDIWKRAVREVLNSFKKFMYYILETRPDRAQYFLSLEKLYQIQMDDMIREASEELKKVDTSETEVPEKDVELQPTMEIKCPSHEIRYPSERSTRTGSSSDTDIEKDTRAAKVADHAVDAAIRAVLPTPEMSVGGEDEDRIVQLEEMISLFVTQDSEVKVDGAATIEEVCEEETTERSVRGPLVEETSDPEIPVEEFTRRRIRDMLQIISRRKPQIKGHIHLYSNFVFFKCTYRYMRPKRILLKSSLFML